MIAVETNILVYAHREDVEEHERAHGAFSTLLGSGVAWAIPWPCVHEFIGTVTRPKYYVPPTPLETALAAVAAILQGRNLPLLHEGPTHFELLKSIALRAGATGARIHDARIAAICIANGVSELWSADREFSRFPDLKVVNPLVR